MNIRLCAVPMMSALLMSPAAVQAEDLAAAVGDAQRRRDALVDEVRSVRKYVLRNPRWKNAASMEVQFTWNGDASKTYEILAMNADGMQKRVLMRVLDGEVDATARHDEGSVVNSDNYELLPVGTQQINGRPCTLVDLRPKKAARFAIEGRACIDTEDAAVVWLEGRTRKNVSFWVGRPYVVQEFSRIGEFWFSSRNRSTANVKLIGTTELTIEYLDYAITPKRGEVLTACRTVCASLQTPKIAAVQPLTPAR